MRQGPTLGMLQHTTEHTYSQKCTISHTLRGQFTVESPINLQHMLLDCAKKPENPEESLGNTGLMHSRCESTALTTTPPWSGSILLETNFRKRVMVLLHSPMLSCSNLSSIYCLCGVSHVLLASIWACLRPTLPLGVCYEDVRWPSVCFNITQCFYGRL